MKRLEKERLKYLREVISQLPISNDDECVLFFPIEIEKETISSEEGIQMTMSLSSLSTGANSLVNYGVIPTRNGTSKESEVVAVITDLKNAITLDLNDYLNLVGFDSLLVLRQYDCKIIKKSSIAFKIKI